MSGFEYMLTQATDEEFDAWIGCPHDAGSYQDAGPLTGEVNARCSKCHSVVGVTAHTERDQ
jgi:hypothetical protein